MDDEREDRVANLLRVIFDSGARDGDWTAEQRAAFGELLSLRTLEEWGRDPLPRS